MSLIKNKKSTELKPTNGNGAVKTKKAPPNFYIKIEKKNLLKMDEYLAGIPHGIAMNIIMFFQQFEKISIPVEINPEEEKTNEINVQ